MEKGESFLKSLSRGKCAREARGDAHPPLDFKAQNGVEERQVTCRLARCRSKGVMSKGGISSAEGGFALALQQTLAA